MEQQISVIISRRRNSRRLRRRFPAIAFVFMLQMAACGFCHADTISLQDGRMIEGRLSKLNSMILNPGVAPPNANGATPIVMVDNDLCRTYVPFKFVQNANPRRPASGWRKSTCRKRWPRRGSGSAASAHFSKSSPGITKPNLVSAAEPL